MVDFKKETRMNDMKFTTAGDYMADVEKKNLGDETWQTKANKAVPRYYSPTELLEKRVTRLEQDLKNLKKELNI